MAAIGPMRPRARGDRPAVSVSGELDAGGGERVSHAALLRAYRATAWRTAAVGAAGLRVGETTRARARALPGSRPRARRRSVCHAPATRRRRLLAAARHRRAPPLI